MDRDDNFYGIAPGPPEGHAKAMPLKGLSLVSQVNSAYSVKSCLLNSLRLAR